MPARRPRPGPLASLAALAAPALLAVLLAAPGRAAEPADPAAPPRAPRRADRGDLIVLHLVGDYREMGRQQAELLGPELRAVYEAMAAAGPWRLWLIDRLGVPLLSWAGRRYEDSGFFHELAGLAEGLGVAPREVMRAAFALAWGSTVFAATGSATADGGALIGRNVDWPDGHGLRRPTVVHYHPTTGDLDYVAAGWVLNPLPTVGLNEAGLALSFNYFETEPQVGTFFPEWPHRRALQTARTVEEAIRVFGEAGVLGIACFMVLADASGDIAMLECDTGECAVFRPEGDWFAQANHARTPTMIPRDRYRSPDSFARLRGMREAVAPHVGALTPQRAAEILRTRTAGPWANAPHVANLAVLNAAVVQPAAGLLWHATSMQPHAPFGAYAPFSPGGDPGDAPVLPADPAFAGGALAREAEAVDEARRAVERLAGGEPAQAAAMLDALARAGGDVLDPSRLAFTRARARWEEGRLEDAFRGLAALEAPEAAWEVRSWGLAMRGFVADRLGRREEAVRLYRATLAHLAERPEHGSYYATLREEVAAGLDGPRGDDPLPEPPYLLRVPR